MEFRQKTLYFLLLALNLLLLFLPLLSPLLYPLNNLLPFGKILHLQSLLHFRLPFRRNFFIAMFSLVLPLLEKFTLPIHMPDIISRYFSFLRLERVVVGIHTL